MGRRSGNVQVAQCHHKGPYKREVEGPGKETRGWKQAGVTWAHKPRDAGGPPEARKGKEIDPPHSLQNECSPAGPSLDLGRSEF